jgi:PAS domain S-box-containing protein
MDASDRHLGAAGDTPWEGAAQAMYRAAQAVAHPGGPALFDEMVRALADILPAATVFIAVFNDPSRTALRTLAAVLDGKPLGNFDYPLKGSPCAQVVGKTFRYVAQGVAADFPPSTVFGAKGMDAYAAFPLNDPSGTPLGLLVAMDRRPIADAALAEALLKIFAGRITAEIERGRADKDLREAALAVSRAHDESLFAELTRYLATILQVDVAFVACHEPGAVPDMRMVAMHCDGHAAPAGRYALATSPCAEVFGREFRAFPSGLRERFPADADALVLGLESYAGFPLTGRDGRPLGTVGVASRQPLVHPERIESMLQIFAVRAAAELETLRANEALRRSEASYRAIFESAEDAIFIHDWDSGAVIDVNPKACTTYGYTREELRRLSVADLSSGEPPYTADQALAYIQRAKLDRCPPFEWHRRNQDGSLHWDEVRLKPARIEGRPHVLAFTREITAQKDALEALRASEAQYRDIFNASADALVLRAADFGIVEVNATYEQMSGYCREEVLGIDRVLANPPEAGAEIRALHARALGGEPIELRTQLVRRDGQRYELELRGVPVAHGGRPHVLYIGRDITQSVLAEKALSDSESRYRAIFNASSDVLTLWNADYRRVDVNPAYERLYGWTREEVIGRGFEFPPYSSEHLRLREDFLRRALQGETVQGEHDVITKSGERRLAEIEAVPFRHDGAPHVLVITRDITERKRAEAALRSSEEQYRAILNASADALVLRDGNFRTVEVNPAFVALCGYSREQVLHSVAVMASDAPGETTTHLELHARVLAGEVLRFERTVRRRNGEPRRVEVRCTPVTYRDQPHVLYAVRDMTERHEAERQRAALEAQLRQAQKMEAIGQLTGGIAHDFNNILTSVLGYLVLGQERAQAIGDATLVRQLGQAQVAAQRARDLIAQMLAFARRQRGERRVMALPGLVRQSLQLLRPTLPATVALDTRALDALPAHGLPPVRADAVQLEQVLFNLCINARDATQGGGVIRLGLGLARGEGLHCTSCGRALGSGPWVELAVADSGSGIAPEVLRRMFEPFFSTKEVGRGSGMGLAMVHGIVHEHEGHVIVETALGAGTTFRVLIPAAEPGETAEAALPGNPRAERPALAGRVLLVEDEAMVGDFMAELLDGCGLQVVLLRDPLAALAWLEDGAHAADLLVTDQTMPHMTGLELARRARALRPGLAVIVYTGNTESLDEAMLERAGVRELLRKPVDPDALRAALQQALA